ncbi:MAG TPA: hypothetical protein VMR86_13845 [Myxococcota bacterium]|nr:hypothetical protein [Myxococcota bacterium]
MREQKKAERAELKRATRQSPDSEVPKGGQVADRADLDSYGVLPPAADPRKER